MSDSQKPPGSDDGVFNPDEWTKEDLVQDRQGLLDTIERNQQALSGACKQRDALRTRLNALQAAIRAHRDQRGHDRCFLDDEMLYGVLPEGAVGSDRTLPPREEFLEGCARFWERRQTGVSFEHCSLNAVMAERDRLASTNLRLIKAIEKLIETHDSMEAADAAMTHYDPLSDDDIEAGEREFVLVTSRVEEATVAYVHAQTEADDLLKEIYAAMESARTIQSKTTNP